MENTTADNTANSSITDVAALANVSTATVSRVLTGRRTKDDDIARRVRKAANQLNYSVNYAASALRSDVTNTLGIVMPDPLTPLSSHLLSRFEAAANDAGKQLLVALGADESTQRSRIDTLVSRKADGIVALPCTGADLSPTLEDYVRSVPIVQVSGHCSSFHVNWVGIDETASMQMAMDHLADYNSTAIAFLSAAVDSSAAAELFITFQSSANLLNLLTEPEWTTFGDCSAKRGYDDTMRLFTSRGTHPNGLICATDAIALGALMALHTLGIGVPDDVLVIGSGDSPESAISSPTLTSTRAPVELIVSETMRLLGNEHGSQHWLPAHIAFPPRLVQRESTTATRIGSSDMAAPGTPTESRPREPRTPRAQR
ncbi:MAG: LacI family transcriptional regulator [Bifidobacterium sp.]|jgi:LacI family transcriptional regulator|nr:LacI family transcriptional regulator [Bifidobacterium sp.]MCI1864716.1 LacI family transcriptional regulator [Bifidobacterium sp.]